MQGLPCSDSSALAGEPAAGSAVASTWRWLGLEYRPSWSAKAVEQATLPPTVRAWIDRFSAEPGTRVQLLRRPGPSDGPLTVQLADTRAGWVRQVELDAYEDLLGLDLEQAPLAPGPVIWVCTHGQRDVCCARHGGRVFAAMRERIEGAWQTSHLGGHRFAATLLWLPEGICYGRLREVDVAALVEAHAGGALFRLDTVRGRVAWSRRAQAAEIALRRALGERELDAVALVGEGADHVILRCHGQEHRFEVREEELPRPVVASCGQAAKPASILVASPAPAAAPDGATSPP